MKEMKKFPLLLVKKKLVIKFSIYNHTVFIKQKKIYNIIVTKIFDQSVDYDRVLMNICKKPLISVLEVLKKNLMYKVVFFDSFAYSQCKIFT